MGFVVGEGDIETVCASFIQRFYRGRCADVYLLGSCRTLAGCFLMLERGGTPARRSDRSIGRGFRAPKLARGDDGRSERPSVDQIHICCAADA
jgi:hypothetical protein